MAFAVRDGRIEYCYNVSMTRKYCLLILCARIGFNP